MPVRVHYPGVPQSKQYAKAVVKRGDGSIEFQESRIVNDPLVGAN